MLRLGLRGAPQVLHSFFNSLHACSACKQRAVAKSHTLELFNFSEVERCPFR